MADDLVELKMDASERKRAWGDYPDAPDYNYGLKITLGHDELTKLGVDVSDLRGGADVEIVAQARVSSIEDNEVSGERRMSLGLQIERMVKPRIVRPSESLASALYKSGGRTD